MSDINADDQKTPDLSEAARKSEEAGIADESAAYVDAIDSTDDQPPAAEAEAHPS
ncbi:hypothetical protein [Sphingomonas sp. RS2018]